MKFGLLMQVIDCDCWRSQTDVYWSPQPSTLVAGPWKTASTLPSRPWKANVVNHTGHFYGAL